MTKYYNPKRTRNIYAPADGKSFAISRSKLDLFHDTPNLIENNRRWHQLLVDGIDVEFKRPDGSIAGDKVWPIDFDHIDRNDWLVLNQYTVIEVGAKPPLKNSSPPNRTGQRGLRPFAPTSPPPRCRDLRQRPAARRDRTEKHRR